MIGRHGKSNIEDKSTGSGIGIERAKEPLWQKPHDHAGVRG